MKLKTQKSLLERPELTSAPPTTDTAGPEAVRLIPQEDF